MKIALFGASGMIGQRVLKEAVSRGHEVTAIVRDPSKITEKGPKVHAVKGDVLNTADVAKLVAGHDAVISAYSPMSTGSPDALLTATRSLIAGMKQAGVKRLIAVGGAGGLEVAPGKKVIDLPDFPAAWKGIAQAHIDALKVYETEAGTLDWTNLSPAAMIEPGQRTGQFRTADNQLIADSAGNSKISAEDYAIALLNELEKPTHIKKRFTVGY